MGYEAVVEQLRERLGIGFGETTTDGRFTPAKSGAGKVVAEFSGQRVEIPVAVAGLEGNYVPDFIRDVNPILSRLGCNQGTCHGAAKGKNGFKLSLRGYEAAIVLTANGWTNVKVMEGGIAAWPFPREK